jgi:hypothetical protein
MKLLLAYFPLLDFCENSPEDAADYSEQRSQVILYVDRYPWFNIH